MWRFVETNSRSLPRPELIPLLGLLGPLDQPSRLAEQAFARHGVGDDAELARPLGIDRLTRANQLGGLGRADQARQPLRSAPTGHPPDLHLRPPHFLLPLAPPHALSH